MPVVRSELARKFDTLVPMDRYAALTAKKMFARQQRGYRAVRFPIDFTDVAISPQRQALLQLQVDAIRDAVLSEVYSSVSLPQYTLVLELPVLLLVGKDSNSHTIVEDILLEFVHGFIESSITIWAYTTLTPAAFYHMVGQLPDSKIKEFLKTAQVGSDEQLLRTAPPQGEVQAEGLGDDEQPPVSCCDCLAASVGFFANSVTAWWSDDPPRPVGVPGLTPSEST